MYLYFPDEEKSNIIVCSTILLGIFTCGTSVLLWWLYKKCCSSKEKYDVEGTLCTYGYTLMCIQFCEFIFSDVVFLVC